MIPSAAPITDSGSLNLQELFPGGITPPAPAPSATPVSPADAALALFKPTFEDPLYFQQNLFVAMSFHGYEGSVPINPRYCATDYTAALLSVIFTQFSPKVIPGPPIGAFGSIWGGGFSLSATVPWFQLSDGTKINVAWIAQYFAHGYSASYAMANALAEITGDMAANTPT